MSTTDHPEYCPDPTGDHKHSESWYDCKPCEFCGDDSPTPGCDCGRQSHRFGGQPELAVPITVEIDVYDDSMLVEEAKDKGCKAVQVSTLFARTQWHVSGPTDLLRELLAGWGYDEDDYVTLAVTK